MNQFVRRGILFLSIVMLLKASPGFASAEIMFKLVGAFFSIEGQIKEAKIAEFKHGQILTGIEEGTQRIQGAIKSETYRVLVAESVGIGKDYDLNRSDYSTDPSRLVDLGSSLTRLSAKMTELIKNDLGNPAAMILTLYVLANHHLVIEVEHLLRMHGLRDGDDGGRNSKLGRIYRDTLSSIQFFIKVGKSFAKSQRPMLGFVFLQVDGNEGPVSYPAGIEEAIESLTIAGKNLIDLMIDLGRLSDCDINEEIMLDSVDSCIGVLVSAHSKQGLALKINFLESQPSIVGSSNLCFPEFDLVRPTRLVFTGVIGGKVYIRPETRMSKGNLACNHLSDHLLLNENDGEWEQFSLVKQADGRYLIRSYFGKHLSVAPNGDLIFTGHEQEWEMFDILKLDVCRKKWTKR